MVRAPVSQPVRPQPHPHGTSRTTTATDYNSYRLLQLQTVGRRTDDYSDPGSGLKPRFSRDHAPSFIDSKSKSAADSYQCPPAGGFG
ncbi:unnamed protein product, partial [Nesidiocoris tenuis]